MRILEKTIFVSLSYCTFAFGVNPNPPTWPTTVKVFTTATPNATIQSTADAIFSTNGGTGDNGQFVNQGYALMFAPGIYSSLQINIGYYTQILGMGVLPTDTSISNVNSPAGGSTHAVGSLNSFWRSAENFSTTPTGSWSTTALIGMTWAVSQAAPLRKVYVNGTLYLFQLYPAESFASGFGSGGYMGDCQIAASTMTQSAVVQGSQQQWCTRNSKMTVPTGSTEPTCSNGVWNQVFVGTTGAPATHCSNCPSSDPTPPCDCVNCSSSVGCTATCNGNPYTTVDTTPRIAEKPYITSNGTASSYSLVIPGIATNKVGTSTDNAPLPDTVTVDFTNVYVADPATDTAATINARIAMGEHVVLTPGIYNLTAPLQIDQPDIVLLGIGLPILISTTGEPCVVVGSVSGVRAGGFILQAGPSSNPVTPTLLRWGSEGGDTSITSGFLYDCFARSGRFSGSSSEPFNQTNLFVQINSDNIVLDNLWLWRADHDSVDIEVKNGDNSCLTGCEINGDNVIAYGLASEHTLRDLTVWNGNNGQCYFYQSEFPYDATSDYGTNQYVGYRLGSQVTSHMAWGVGVYSFFRDHQVTAFSAISTPLSSGIFFINSLTRFLNGNGGIQGIVNGKLGMNTKQANTSAVSAQFPGPAYLCDYTEQTIQPRSQGQRRL